jgi:hypothetical protein
VKGETINVKRTAVDLNYFTKEQLQEIGASLNRYFAMISKTLISKTKQY